jgi:hypothetical protein
VISNQVLAGDKWSLVLTLVSADPATAMSPAEVTEKLGLHRMKDRSWYVHPR